MCHDSQVVHDTPAFGELGIGRTKHYKSSENYLDILRAVKRTLLRHWCRLSAKFLAALRVDRVG